MIIIFFALSFISCNSDDEITDTQTTTIKAKTEIDNTITQENEISYSKDRLVIEGTDIWIRNKPITGEVVMKLNTGDICKILEIGEEDQIYNNSDFWYKIEYNDTIGWVYGAQTNIKSREIHDVIPFNLFLKEFLQAYQNKDNDLDSFTQKEISNTFLFNPGAYCAEYYSNDIKREFSQVIKPEHIFNRKPKGDFCEGYLKEKSGFYYWKIKSTELPKFPDMTNEELRIKEILLPVKYTNNTFCKTQVIIDENHFSYLYFINIGNTWYLFCEDRCDCSA